MTIRFIATCLCLLGATMARADMVFFEQNSSLSPANDTYSPLLTEAGFAFTPTSNVDLSGFRTKFNGMSDGRSVSFQLFASSMGIPDTSVALVNQSFIAIGGGVLTGVDFSPFTLIGGTQYFAALTNLGGLGVNYVADPSAADSPTGEVRFTLAGDPGRFGNPDNDPPENQPIFQFLTPAVVPEPSTTVLLALCGVIGGGFSYRRRRTASC